MTEKIIVDAGYKKSKISRHIYGHFAEHLGRCIYGGFWTGRDSQIPNIHGYNKAVVEAFKKLNIPNLRWPGGCFADEYHWKDGIGPEENRKRMINTNWGGVVEDNSFGTHEFLGLCDELGCEPYICGNVGSGSVQEMDEWIEYMTFEGESPMANLRKANGHEKAWHIPFFGVGNENWGCGGNMRPEYYSDLYRRYQTFVRQYGKEKIQKIAGGPNVDDYNWTDVLMKNAHWLMNGLSLHYYTYEYNWGDKRSSTDFDKDGWYRTVKNAWRMEELIRRHGEIMDKYDPEKKVALVVDEWGCWHQVEPGTNPGFLYQQNSVRDAVTAAITLNIFNNNSDRVRMANLAQAVNVLQSPVLTEGDRTLLTPTWYVLHMYREHQDAALLQTSTACTSCGDPEKNLAVPSLSVSASVKHCEKCSKDLYLITLANADSESSKKIELTLAHLGRNIDSVEASVLSGNAMNSINTFEMPDNVTEKTLAAEITDADTVKIILPAHSVAAITVKV